MMMIMGVGVQPDTGLAELIALYYRLVPAEELSTAEPAELAAAVQSHLALAADRVPGRVLVRLLNPTRAEDGWSSRTRWCRSSPTTCRTWWTRWRRASPAACRCGAWCTRSSWSAAISPEPAGGTHRL